MTQYLLSVHHDEAARLRIDAMTPEEAQPMFDATGAFNEELRASGGWVFAGGLHPVDAATCVDATGGGAAVVTDGPFAGSKEHLGGFWVVEAPDLDAALDLAARGSRACGSTVEVRPFQDG